ncbi:MAG: hypothetical protein N2D54_01120 [Chloroflexota bacterium]
MKRYLSIYLISLSVFLAGCVRAAPNAAATLDPTRFLEELLKNPTAVILQKTETPVGSDDANSSASPAGTESQDLDPTVTPFIVTPTEENPVTPTPVFTKTPETPPTAGPTNTPTTAPTPSEPPFDPQAEFKRVPTYVDDFETDDNWVSKVTGALPDTENLQLVLKSGLMEVTGKYQEYDTWWMAPTVLRDFYLEIEVDSGKCSGSDAYGVIVRADSGELGVHGYIIAFTCDGQFFVRRMDSTNPYYAEQTFIPTNSDLIKRGSNKTNLLGVLFEDNTYTIYANGYPVNGFGTIDSTFEFGRYGLFVKAGPTENYTYSIHNMRVWNLSK